MIAATPIRRQLGTDPKYHRKSDVTLCSHFARELTSDRTGRRSNDRHDAVAGPRRGNQQHAAKGRPPGALHLAAGRPRSRGRADAAQSRDADCIHRRAGNRPRIDHEDQAADGPGDAGADRARTRRRGRDCGRDAPRRAGRGHVGQSQPPAVGRDARAARLSPGARALHDAVVGARVPRAAAEVSRGLGRRHHARAGRASSWMPTAPGWSCSAIPATMR